MKEKHRIISGSKDTILVSPGSYYFTKISAYLVMYGHHASSLFEPWLFRVLNKISTYGTSGARGDFDETNQLDLFCCNGKQFESEQLNRKKSFKTVRNIFVGQLKFDQSARRVTSSMQRRRKKREFFRDKILLFVFFLFCPLELIGTGFAAKR